MSYWDAVLATVITLGWIAVGLLAVFFWAYCLLVATITHRPWWVRTLAAMYVVGAVVFGIAGIVWDVSNG